MDFDLNDEHVSKTINSSSVTTTSQQDKLVFSYNSCKPEQEGRGSNDDPDNSSSSIEIGISKTINDYIQSTLEYEPSVYNSIYLYIPDTSTTLMLLAFTGLAVLAAGASAPVVSTVGVGEVAVTKALDCCAGIAYGIGSHLVAEESFNILQAGIAAAAA